MELFHILTVLVVTQLYMFVKSKRGYFYWVKHALIEKGRNNRLQTEEFHGFDRYSSPGTPTSYWQHFFISLTDSEAALEPWKGPVFNSKYRPDCDYKLFSSFQVSSLSWDPSSLLLGNSSFPAWTSGFPWRRERAGLPGGCSHSSKALSRWKETRQRRRKSWKSATQNLGSGPKQGWRGGMGGHVRERRGF